MMLQEIQAINIFELFQEDLCQAKIMAPLEALTALSPPVTHLGMLCVEASH